ncbi:MAG: hypothetical protein ACKVG1_07370 [Rhodospirillales bacterium]|jgi:hypothetical protein
MNDILEEDETLDALRLAAIKMPNRNGFILPDPRPDIKKDGLYERLQNRNRS